MNLENTLVNKAVAFIVTPIVAALAGFFVVWVEGWSGTDLPDADVKDLAVAVSIFTGLQIVNYLRNKHDWQLRLKSGEIAEQGGVYVNKLVTFVVTPLVLTGVGILVLAVENAIDTDLNDAEIKDLAVAVVSLTGLALVQWLKGKHEWQVGDARRVPPTGSQPGATVRRGQASPSAPR